MVPSFSHGDELLDAPGTGLGLLGALDPIEDGVTVLAAERGEARRRHRVVVERSLEVVGHGGLARGVIRGVPSTVGPGPLHLGQAGRLHPAFFDEALDLGAVDLRPVAASAPGREPLEEPLIVEAVPLPVDPAVTERDVERLGVGHARDAGGLLGDLDLNAARGGVMLRQPRQPRLPRRLRGEGDDRIGQPRQSACPPGDRTSELLMPDVMSRATTEIQLPRS